VFESCGIGVLMGDVGAKGTVSAGRAPCLAPAAGCGDPAEPS